MKRWLQAWSALMLRKITLSSAPFLASLVVITSLTMFIGIFWSINEYRAYQESIDNIRHNYRNQYETRLTEEIDKVIELIDYRRRQDVSRVESDIRERVQAAYSIASHNYRLYKNEKSIDDLRSMISELLRPIRWNNGRGYYFAGQIFGDKIDLFADEPFFEGKTGGEFAAINDRDVIGEIGDIVRSKEAGLYRYDLVKPKFSGRLFPTIVFVKYFPPLDWFIGAGIYSDDLEANLQQSILSRIQSFEFGKDGEVFCFRADGTIISARDERFIGRSVRDLVDANGREYGSYLLDTAMGDAHQGFVHAAFTRDGSELLHQKLGFVRSYRDWNWVIGASMFMDAMEKTIASETKTYRRIAFKNVFAFIILFALAVVFLLLSTLLYSYKIKQGINRFTDFFREAADANVKISNEGLLFREFEDLGRLANRMVDDRIKHEQLLHRDELRLDTLLQLGMMEKQSLQEKYDFLLQRIVQITRSEAGYLVLADAAQAQLQLCSVVVRHGYGKKIDAEMPGVSRTLAHGGFPAEAVRRQAVVIENKSRHEEGEALFPYRQPVLHHLDVPIFNDGKIVIIAGVCSNEVNYDTADARQVTMLLEGLWLHVIKKSSEEEMERLERQIIAVSEEERSNIGRDLHDDLGSHLTGVELLSKALQQKLQAEAPERAEQLGFIRTLIKEAIEKTRRLSHGLYPVHVVEYGLASAIEELAGEVKKIFSVNFDFSWEGTDRELGKNTAIHLHYIIREAVFNAARHGRPKNIGIYAHFSSQSFVVRIVDDGVGFDATPAATGMGFHTMKYRAKAIKAELVIKSVAEGGTVITVTGEGLE